MDNTIESPEINFDFRFDPAPLTHLAFLKVRQELIEAYLNKEHPSGFRRSSLYPVARAGKSGSEVFYLDVFFHGHEKPRRQIAKFQNIRKTKEELEGANSAIIARFCQSVDSELHSSEDLGVIVYNLATASDHIEFRGYFLDLGNADESCVIALRSIFQDIGRTANGEAERINLIKDYDLYVDRKTKPLHRLIALSSPGDDVDGLGGLAQNIQETYQRIRGKYDKPVYPYAVHGDLHARNLMLSRSNPAKTELIDFGWVHSGHPAKDFVLMECTLKYMLLPELLQAGRSNERENLYFTAKQLNAFENYIGRFGFELPPVDEMLNCVFADSVILKYQRTCITRTYMCMAEVRRAAGEVLDSYCKKHNADGMTALEHYSVGFFLVTLGLLEMPELDRLGAMIGLRTLGEFL